MYTLQAKLQIHLALPSVSVKTLSKQLVSFMAERQIPN